MNFQKKMVASDGFRGKSSNADGLRMLGAIVYLSFTEDISYLKHGFKNVGKKLAHAYETVAFYFWLLFLKWD